MYVHLIHWKITCTVLIVTAGHQTFSGQRLGLCNPLSIWAVITTEQIPSGLASSPGLIFRIRNETDGRTHEK